MSDATVRGIVHFIDDTKSYGQKGFRKRMVVLEQSQGRYTNYVPVEFTSDDCDSVDELKVGDDVEISYRLSGRRWQRDEQSEVKYFLSAEATGFRNLSSPSASRAAGTASTDDANKALAEAGFDEDDVPF